MLQPQTQQRNAETALTVQMLHWAVKIVLWFGWLVVILSLDSKSSMQTINVLQHATAIILVVD